MSGGNERILLVDDGDAARMQAMIMSLNGYKVMTETRPAMALEIFRSDPGAFDLIITDMSMPQMTRCSGRRNRHKI